MDTEWLLSIYQCDIDSSNARNIISLNCMNLSVYLSIDLHCTEVHALLCFSPSLWLIF